MMLAQKFCIQKVPFMGHFLKGSGQYLDFGKLTQKRTLVFFYLKEIFH